MAASTSRTRTSVPALLLTLLAFQSVAPVQADVKWDPNVHVKRNTTSLIAKRAPKHQIPRTPRLSKRQTVQPGQPLHQIPDSLVGGFEIVGLSGVSGQQLFLGTENKVYIIDKVENNPAQVNGHPAWAVEYDLVTNQYREMDVVTNTFCAGGSPLGDGRWLNVGGNQAVDPNGVDSTSQTGNNVYQNADGGRSMRILTPGDGSEWIDVPDDDLTTRRWYPTLETLEDGRIIIIGGNKIGGFVNSVENNNPTYEFFPKAPGASPIQLDLLLNTLPANLYPITHLIPTGQLLMNINLKSIMFDYKAGDEFALPAVPKAVRTYPASAANMMLPMKVSDQWLATVMYCGGSDLQPEQWVSGLRLIDVPGSTSCIKISPEVSAEFEDDDDLPEGRVMANGIILPDGTILVVNGGNTGVAGYGFDAWTREDSYADNPIYSPVIYDPTRPAGSRWSRVGLKDSTVARMYHSTATLLPDGSVFIAGSNPHPDFNDRAVFPSEYRVERFYPLYYNKRRPEPAGVPTKLGYGGDFFELELSKEDLFDNIGNVKTIKIMIMKTGFSTHSINFGMRAAELDFTYTANSNGGATLHVSQLPPNPAIMPPGPAWLYVTVNGVPSVGVSVMCGSGEVEAQVVSEPEVLPASSEVSAKPDSKGKSSANGQASFQLATGSLVLLLTFMALWA